MEPTTPEADKTDTALIVAIALGSVAAVGLASFIVVWYITRRKPNIMLDEEFVDHTSSQGGDDDIVMVPPPSEDPRVFVPGQQVQDDKEGISQAYPSQSSFPETDPNSENDEDKAYDRSGSL